jgi:hypothetical protein
LLESITGNTPSRLSNTSANRVADDMPNVAGECGHERDHLHSWAHPSMGFHSASFHR